MLKIIFELILAFVAIYLISGGWIENVVEWIKRNSISIKSFWKYQINKFK